VKDTIILTVVFVYQSVSHSTVNSNVKKVICNWQHHWWRCTVVAVRNLMVTVGDLVQDGISTGFSTVS